MFLSSPYSWDSLERDVLQKSVNLIESLSENFIKGLIIENCQKFLGFIKLESQDISIKKHPLLGVEKVAIIVQFYEYPITEDENFHMITGMVRLIQVEEAILPIVMIFPNASVTTLEHECIHLCQLLNHQVYLLTIEERIAVFQQSREIAVKKIIREDPSKALDFLIRITCYTVWMEMEAHHFTLSQESVLDRAQRSSMPFGTLENLLIDWNFYEVIPSAMDICNEAFSNFCDSLEKQVEWVKNLVNISGSSNLQEALYWCKEIYETEMMSWPFNDYDE